jgi:hypothetical protein
MKLRFGILLGVVAAAAIAAPASADTTLTVTPLNEQGWFISAAGQTQVSFVTGVASTGTGSLQIEIGGSQVGPWFNLAPPYTGPVANLNDFSYDYYIDPASNAPGIQSHYFGVVLMIFLPGVSIPAGLVHCTYTHLPEDATPGWHSTGFSQETTWTNVHAVPPSVCPPTLAELPPGASIGWFILQSAIADAPGVKGGFDNVQITIRGDTTTYDFEPVPGRRLSLPVLLSRFRYFVNWLVQQTLLVVPELPPIPDPGPR